MVRRSKKLDLKKIIVIFCEGETERNYFNMLRLKYRSANVQIKFKKLGNGNGLITRHLSEIKECRRKYKNCEIYVCFDRDDLTLKELQQQLKEAKDNNLKVMYSNVSFEVWLLNHFRKLSHIREMTHNDLYNQLQKFLNVSDYKDYKGSNMTNDFIDRVRNALENTKEYASLENNPQLLNCNPYTNVGIEVKLIFDLTDKQKDKW
ncbi:RloB family protein [Lactobacillus sp. ESL0731]|uniref:RloB family protein n=1 Tax=unclassified Lactobacillus TaxID=2620435 RepID=UPI0023F84D02|nr:MULTISPECIES: RloB family protein [unclassified Lactobacillus]WEV50957.1 RloB family protein [Lactobacillus sp. ESL0700]WEV62088.1 RloB family protein [Lactobacillus sp. ESL0731]